jgi:rare lipoprotein A
MPARQTLASTALLVAVLVAVASCAVSHRTPAPDPAPAAVPAPFVQEGRASWYGGAHRGKTTANGEKFDPSALTAAHRTLPLGTEVKVTNLANGESVNVRINDRGPYVRRRVIDLSDAAARKIGMHAKGTAEVRIEEIRPAEGSVARKD